MAAHLCRRCSWPRAPRTAAPSSPPAGRPGSPRLARPAGAHPPPRCCRAGRAAWGAQVGRWRALPLLVQTLLFELGDRPVHQLNIPPMPALPHSPLPSTLHPAHHPPSPVHLGVAADVGQHVGAHAKQVQRGLVPRQRPQVHQVGARGVAGIGQVQPAAGGAACAGQTGSVSVGNGAHDGRHMGGRQPAPAPSGWRPRKAGLLGTAGRSRNAAATTTKLPTPPITITPCHRRTCELVDEPGVDGAKHAAPLGGRRRHRGRIVQQPLELVGGKVGRDGQPRDWSSRHSRRQGASVREGGKAGRQAA